MAIDFSSVTIYLPDAYYAGHLQEMVELEDRFANLKIHFGGVACVTVSHNPVSALSREVADWVATHLLPT